MSLALNNWAQFFKTNDIFNLRIIKTLIIKYGLYANILAEKNVSSFCKCKYYSHFFSKNTFEFDTVLTRTVNILTTNNALNNWALINIFLISA